MKAYVKTEEGSNLITSISSGPMKGFVAAEYSDDTILKAGACLLENGTIVPASKAVLSDRLLSLRKETLGDDLTKSIQFIQDNKTSVDNLVEMVENIRIVLAKRTPQTKVD